MPQAHAVIPAPATSLRPVWIKSWRVGVGMGREAVRGRSSRRGRGRSRLAGAEGRGKRRILEG